ncbi:hypothetical protein KR044_004757, partial [Drosophila immigrans]
EMLNSLSWLAALLLCGFTIALGASSDALQQDGSAVAMSNSIAAPGQPLYYLMADAGPTVGPNDELKRTNRSLMKWWEDLFGPNNCCNNNNNLLPINNNLLPINNNLLPINNNLLPLNSNNVLPVNNCNGLQLQNLDPFKQMKLFKKLPDLWGNNCGGQCGQCGNNYVQPVDAYAPPQPQPAPVPAPPADYNSAPVAPPSDSYVAPNPAYDGPGDGDAGYAPPPPPAAAPAEDNYIAPPTVDTYAAPPAPAPPAASYEAPVPTPPSYEPAPAPAPQSYSKVEEYEKPEKSYGGAQPPQIVYQPIIYLSTSTADKADIESKLKLQEQMPFYSYPAPPPPPATPVYAAPPPAPVHATPPPAPSYAPPPAAPPAPAYSAPACQTPIRLSLYDQPYRVAPELFQEYNYRLSLADHNSL